jgi:CubicO group peptidase (beta-lactamase class C family)
MGDVLPKEALPAEIDAAKLNATVEAAFEPPETLTAAFIVTWKGRIIAERYASGVDMRTPLEGWSMGKSITATLFGILLNKGVYKLTQPAPIPEWQTPGDPRAKIRIEDLLHMSSGLRIRAPQDPDYDPSGPYPDHSFFTQEELIHTTMRPHVRSMAAQHSRPLPQHRPSVDQLPDPARRRERR